MWRDVVISRVAATGLAFSVLGSGTAVAESLDDRLATADPTKGAMVFASCRGCHSVEEGGPRRVGPTLWGITNRPVASVDGYAYSDALKEFGGKWELERLDEFLSDPQAIVPGGRMVIAVEDRTERANLIAYLNQNSAKPLPIGVPPGSTDEDTEAETKKDYGLLVDAPGVEKTHAYCTPCHSEMIIVQQGKTRKRWDDLLTWMTEEQGMVDIQDPDRAIILDYLEAHYNEDRPNFPQR